MKDLIQNIILLQLIGIGVIFAVWLAFEWSVRRKR